MIILEGSACKEQRTKGEVWGGLGRFGEGVPAFSRAQSFLYPTARLSIQPQREGTGVITLRSHFARNASLQGRSRATGKGLGRFADGSARFLECKAYTIPLPFSLPNPKEEELGWSYWRQSACKECQRHRGGFEKGLGRFGEWGTRFLALKASSTHYPSLYLFLRRRNWG